MPRQKYAPSPFVYNSPVPVEQFVNRESTIVDTISRIAQGQNTAIWGGPKIGKSSLLQFLQGGPACGNQLGARFTQIVLVYVDCQDLVEEDTAQFFWKNALMCVWESCSDILLQRTLKRMESERIRARDLDRFFSAVTRREWHIVLMLDNVEQLIDPEKQRKALFEAVYTLSTRARGLTLITTSPFSLKELEQRVKIKTKTKPGWTESFDELTLELWNKQETNRLIEQALNQTEVHFEKNDYAFIYAMSSGQPFLVQAVCDALYKATMQGQTEQARYTAAIETLEQIVSKAGWADTEHVRDLYSKWLTSDFSPGK